MNKKVKLIKSITLAGGIKIRKGSVGVVLKVHEDGSFHFEPNSKDLSFKIKRDEFKYIS